MPVPTNLTDLSTTASSNSPASSESPVDGDNYLRAHAAFVAQLNANKVDRSGSVVPTANLPMGGFKHTGAAAGTASGQYLMYGQSGAALTGPTITGLGVNAAPVSGVSAYIATTGTDSPLRISQADETGSVPLILGQNSAAGGLSQFGVFHAGADVYVGNSRTDDGALYLLTNGIQRLAISYAGNATFAGTVAASNLSGTNTGDQTNIPGNAATATNVAWSGLTSVPAAVSAAAAGTYTPTLTNGTNVSASTANIAMYSRVGDVVSVNGTLLVTPTAAGFAQIDISLPIASTVGGTNYVAGVAASISGTAGTSPARISAAPVQNRAMVYFYDDNGGSRLMSYQFSYVVI